MFPQQRNTDFSLALSDLGFLESLTHNSSKIKFKLFGLD